ncbi:MAG: hypothetical protein ACP5RK_00120 [Candidatus Micrarchaeia archaeon]
MEKRLVYFGALLLVFSLIASYSVATYFFQIPEYYTMNIAIAPNMSTVSQIYLVNSNLTTIIYNSTEPVNFYVVNESVYRVYKLVPPRDFPTNISGVYEAILNSRSGMFSNFIKLNKTQNLVVYNTTGLANGTYYMLFSNVGNVLANVSVVYINQKNNRSYGYEYMFAFGGVAAVLFLAGLALILYGFIKAGREKNEEKLEKKTKDKKSARKTV